MIRHSEIQVGDVVLYKRRKTIKEWVVTKISPSGNYFVIENDIWDERWVFLGDILEIIKHDVSIEIAIEDTSMEIIEEEPNPHSIARWDAKNKK